jgi:hypothetical protein
LYAITLLNLISYQALAHIHDVPTHQHDLEHGLALLALLAPVIAYGVWRWFKQDRS